MTGWLYLGTGAVMMVGTVLATLLRGFREGHKTWEEPLTWMSWRDAMTVAACVKMGLALIVTGTALIMGGK